MNKRQIITHVLTLAVSFGGLALFFFHFQPTLGQVVYAAGLTILLMGAAVLTLTALGFLILRATRQ